MSTATATNPWMVKTSSSEGGDYELPPAGNHPGVLVGLIDIGTHASTYGGETKDRHQVLFVFELTGEHNKDGETFKVIRGFTFSLHAKSTLRGFLQDWQGRKFGEDQEVDITQFMLNPGLINVTDGLSGNGKKFVDVSSVTKLPRGLEAPPATVEPFAWTFDGWDPKHEPPIPGWVPRFMGEPVAQHIKTSHEWKQLVPF